MLRLVWERGGGGRTGLIQIISTVLDLGTTHIRICAPSVQSSVKKVRIPPPVIIERGIELPGRGSQMQNFKRYSPVNKSVALEMARRKLDASKC